MDTTLQNIIQSSSANALLVMTAKDLNEFAEKLIAHTRNLVEAQYNVQFYDVEELARLLHVTKTTIYNFSKDGRLTPQKIGRKTVFNRVAVQEAIKAGTLGRYIHK